MAVVVTGTVVVLAVGLAGGLAGRALRVPGGSLLGAMVAVGALQLTSATTLQISPAWALLGQILVGSVIGSTIDPKMLRSFRRVLVPASIVHFVHPHYSEEERISIAYNFTVYPKGQAAI